MARGRMAAAIRAFELNAESYPGSFNVYDSLAEAHMLVGHVEEAIEFYEKSLEINPANYNTVNKLRQLQKR